MSLEPQPAIEPIIRAVEEAGLVGRGAFALSRAERTGALAGVRTIALIGVAGRRGWDAFAASPEAADGAPDPLDRFSRRVIGGLAEAWGATALYPFGGPPYWPFQRWGERAEPLHPSPIGLYVHPTYGLWHSYRGALAFPAALAVREAAAGPSPCASCVAKPCLTACPVEAHTAAGYEVSACADHLRGPAGAACMARGCRARRACPVGAERVHGPAQAAFAMRSFLAGRDAALSRDCAP